MAFKYAQTFRDLLKDLGRRTELGNIYHHLFALEGDEEIERMLKEYYKISKGKEPAYGEFGKEEWFAIWHKSIRQCDYFTGCYRKYIKRILTGEERARMKELNLVFYDKKVPLEEREKRKEERKEEFKEYFVYYNKLDSEEREDNIGGHLDMLLHSTIYLDKENELYKIFKKVFLEIELDAESKKKKA